MIACKAYNKLRGEFNSTSLGGLLSRLSVLSDLATVFLHSGPSNALNQYHDWQETRPWISQTFCYSLENIIHYVRYGTWVWETFTCLHYNHLFLSVYCLDSLSFHLLLFSYLSCNHRHPLSYHNRVFFYTLPLNIVSLIFRLVNLL
jgi:hypothetical protein